MGAEVLAERAGPAAVEREDRGERVRGARRERIPEGERFLTRRARVADAKEGSATHRVRLQADRGDDGKAPAAAAQRPEQVAVVDALTLAGGGHDVEARHAVEREPKRAAREPHPAAERQPTGGDRRAR